MKETKVLHYDTKKTKRVLARCAYLRMLIQNGIKQGYVRPLAHVKYTSENVPRAFRLLTNNWHRGLVILELTDSTTPTQSRISCTPGHSQLIVCDEEDLAIQLAHRLISRGANILYIHLCCPKLTQYLQYKADSLKSTGVTIHVSANQLEDSDAITSLLRETLFTSPIEGIYVAYFGNKDDVLKHTVQYIDDILSDMSCGTLRYFGVITNNKTVAEQTHITKLNENLAVSFIDVRHSVFYKKNRYEVLLNKAAWNLSLLDALETGLSSASPFIVANIQIEESNVSQQLAVLFDLPSLKEANDITTLEDLVVSNEKIEIIKEWLRRKYHVCLSTQDVFELNKQKLKQLDFVDFEEKDGLNVYFSGIGKDESSSDIFMYFLPTLGNAEAEKQDNKLESDSLWIVPGIEGHHERYRNLCQRLKLPAIVLQPSLDKHDTIPETAQRYSKTLLDNIGIKNSFYFLAQDIGILIAMELAAIFEENGYLGTVFCLGSAPEDVKSLIEKHLAKFITEDQLQLGILKHIYKLLTNEEASDLDEILSPFSSLNERIDASINTMVGRISQTKQYVKALMESVYARILSIKQYDSPLPSLKSKVIVLRSPDSPSTNLYSVENISAPLSDAADDVRCAAVVNKNISKDILEEFEKKNLCDKFVIGFDQQYAKGI